MSRQDGVTLSSSEAEFVWQVKPVKRQFILGNCRQELLKGFGYTQKGPAEIWEDNRITRETGFTRLGFPLWYDYIITSRDPTAPADPVERIDEENFVPGCERAHTGAWGA